MKPPAGSPKRALLEEAARDGVAWLRTAARRRSAKSLEKDGLVTCVRPVPSGFRLEVSPQDHAQITDAGRAALAPAPESPRPPQAPRRRRDGFAPGPRKW